MKKIIAIVFTLGLSVSVFAWGRMGHATVAKIAEDHLTPTAQKAIAEILDGHSIVEYASYADEYKTAKQLLYDFGPDIKDEKRVNSYPHTFEVDMNFKPFPTYNDNGRYVKNCLWFIDQFSKDLKDYETMDEQERFIKLVMVVHWLGDMHCPEHIRYNPEDMTIGGYNTSIRARNSATIPSGISRASSTGSRTAILTLHTSSTLRQRKSMMRLSRAMSMTGERILQGVHGRSIR